MALKEDMADYDMPYERIKKYGATALSDAELLAIVLRTGITDCNPLEIGQKLLLELGKNGLSDLSRMSKSKLKEIPGIGEIKATQLIAIAEIAKRIARKKAYEKLSYNNPETVAEYYIEQLSYESEEQVWCAVLNTKCELIKDKMLTCGTANASLITPREVYRYALEEKGVSVILIHNHPSGDPTPSMDDIELTSQMQSAGKLIGIEFLDHIIIGYKKYISLHELGYIEV